MPNKNILVAGGAGYIGSHMVKLLLEREYNQSRPYLLLAPNKNVF